MQPDENARKPDQHADGQEERRDDLLARLAAADDRGRWVAAAKALHDVGTLLADLARTEFPEAVWGRRALGRAGTVRWFRQLHDRLASAGFDAPIMAELRADVERLEAVGAEPPL